jgi:hypothetical protein
MTENQWPQTPEPYSEPDVYAGTADTTSLSGAPGASSKKEAAKEEASNVAGQTADAAQNVAGTAKAEAANVASEVKTNAQDLLYQAKADLTSQAGAQQQKAAEGIRAISSQLRSMADAPDQQGVASDLVRQAAERSESVASWLDNRDPGSLLDEVKTFARQRPGTFLLLAAGAGVLAGRLGRSLQAGAPASTSAPRTALPPQPVQPPIAEGVVGAGEPFYDETAAGAPVYGGTGYGAPVPPGTGPASAQTLPGGTAGEVPLRDVDDPLAEGEGRHL